VGGCGRIPGLGEQEAGTAAPTVRKDAPTIWRVDDALWAELRPLLVVDKPRKKPGRPRHDDRPLFDGPLWIARSGGQWKALPREFGAKSAVNDRYRAWVAYGCREHAWARRLAVDDDEGGLAWPRQAAAGCRVTAPLGTQGGPARRRRRGRTRPPGASAAPRGTC
jgi:transposase